MVDLKFLHLSDIHYLSNYGGELDKWGVDYDPTPIWTDLLKSYDYRDLDFIVITGDIIHDGELEDYRSFKEVLEGMIPQNMPVYYCMGNHDNRACFTEIFHNQRSRALYKHVQYVKDYRLIFMDTSRAGLHDGVIGQEQEDWLFDILSEDYGKGSLIFHHHPLEISWISGMERTEMSQDYIQRLNETDVIGIFTGHLHQARQVNLGRLPQSTASSLVFGINRIGGELWNTNRLGYSEVEMIGKMVDVYTEMIYPVVTKTTQEFL